MSFDAAADICQRHAKSFYFASRFLPLKKRQHAYAVYAYCRLVDDAVDEARNQTQQQQQLERFEQVLEDCYDNRPITAKLNEESLLALAAFSQTVRECEIPKQHFLDLLEGCRMDLTINRYETWADLENYCYHVAGVVGLIMCRVFDVRDEAALAKAVEMGNAMQLTNILRDIWEDLSRGRIYLPADELARFGVREADLGAGRVRKGFKELMQFEIARARGMYRDAATALIALPKDGSRQTACVMAVVYSGILGAIEKRGYDVFTGRASLSKWQKILRIPRALRLSRKATPKRIDRAFA